jgi:mRNA-degrading endonuclease YafQ of YafQ-DinJ toxin-antitoxin module
MLNLKVTPHFTRKLKKLTKHNKNLAEDVNNTISILRYNPFAPILSSHQVNSLVDGQRHFSCRVTGDIRIIWDFAEKHVNLIGLIDLGGHTGKNKVYK